MALGVGLDRLKLECKVFLLKALLTFVHSDLLLNWVLQKYGEEFWGWSPNTNLEALVVEFLAKHELIEFKTACYARALIKLTCFKNCFQNTALLGRTGSASVTKSLDPRSHVNRSLS
jgi:hypothetical protein